MWYQWAGAGAVPKKGHFPCLKEGMVSWASEFEKHASSVTLTPILGHLNARKLIQVLEQNPQPPSWSMSPEPYSRRHAGKIGPRNTAGCWLCGLNQAQDLVELSLNPAPSSTTTPTFTPQLPPLEKQNTSTAWKGTGELRQLLLSTPRGMLSLAAPNLAQQ